jgi:hypothetical protein
LKQREEELLVRQRDIDRLAKERLSITLKDEDLMEAEKLIRVKLDLNDKESADLVRRLTETLGEVQRLREVNRLSLRFTGPQLVGELDQFISGKMSPMSRPST